MLPDVVMLYSFILVATWKINTVRGASSGMKTRKLCMISVCAIINLVQQNTGKTHFAVHLHSCDYGELE